LERILVVDDNRQIADFLAHKVLPSLGYSGLAAYSGKRALTIIEKQSQQLCLVVLDWQLPDMTGLDVLQQMKERKIRLPTIIITGEGSEEVAVDALRLGVQDYLIKPVDADALGEAIDRALETVRLRNQKTLLTARLKNQLSWMSDLSKIGQFITSSLELDEVLKRIIDSATELAHADQGSIALLESPGEHLYLRALRQSRHSSMQYMRVPVSIPHLKKVLITRKPVKGVGEQEAALRNLIHLPLITGGEAIGVLSISRNVAGEFTAEEGAKLEALTDYAAIAINNAHEFNQAHNGASGSNDAGEMQRAIDQNEFELHYQPIVSFEKHQLIGFEALLRWNHPQRGIILPGDFLPAATGTDLVPSIDDWVMRQVCKQINMWEKESISNVNWSVGVNISSPYISREGFFENVRSFLKEYHLDPQRLVFEISERAFAHPKSNLVDLIKALSRFGIDTMVDEFGISQSSLRQLSQVPLNALKIDRSHTKNILGDHRQREILDTIVALTKRLKVNIGAEGIETQSQFDYLKNCGCSFGQGYLLGKPMDSSAVSLMLQTS